MAEAVRDGKLAIPISVKLPLSKAAEAQALAEKGGSGKSCWWLELRLRYDRHERKIVNEERSRGINPASKPRGMVCGMSGVSKRLVVSSPAMCGVRARRMRRQFSESIASMRRRQGTRS